MTINPFITKAYPTVSLNEEMESLAAKFVPEAFFVVLNNDNSPVGIITYYDFLKNLTGTVENCSFVKPRLSPQHKVVEAFRIMAKEGCYVLPVYDKREFIGIVSHAELSYSLIGQCKGYKQLFKKVIKSLRAPIANLLGITNILETTTNDAERSEIIDLAAKSCKKAISILNELEEVEQKGVTTSGFQNTELNSFIQKCISTTPIYTKKIKITFHPSATEFFYPINRLNFREAIQNLISDVVRFSDPFGKVDIEGVVSENTYTLRIKEEGIRTPIYLKPEISASSLKEPSIDNHQDVYFIKTCIEGHNGRIWFENLKEEGTLINIQFHI